MNAKIKRKGAKMQSRKDLASTKARTAHAASSGLDVDFPDWGGHQASRSKIRKEEMLRYCESVLPFAKSKPDCREMRRRSACSVEFSLD